MCAGGVSKATRPRSPALVFLGTKLNVKHMKPEGEREREREIGKQAFPHVQMDALEAMPRDEG